MKYFNKIMIIGFSLSLVTVSAMALQVKIKTSNCEPTKGLDCNVSNALIKIRGSHYRTSNGAMLSVPNTYLNKKRNVYLLNKNGKLLDNYNCSANYTFKADLDSMKLYCKEINTNIKKQMGSGSSRSSGGKST